MTDERHSMSPGGRCDHAGELRPLAERGLEMFAEELRPRVVQVRRRYRGNLAAADLVTSAVGAAAAGDHDAAAALIAKAESLLPPPVPPGLRSAVRDGITGWVDVPVQAGAGVTVAADGSSGGDGRIGWAFVASSGLWGLQARDYSRREWVHGAAAVISAELRAVYMALKAIEGPVTVLSDSAGAVSQLNAWKAGGVRRMPRWYDATARRGRQKPTLVMLAEMAAARSGEVVFAHVRGHCGHPLNEGADRIAGMARRWLATAAPGPGLVADAQEAAREALAAWGDVRLSRTSPRSEGYDKPCQ